MSEPTITIPASVAKYALAVLLDPTGATDPTNDRMAVYSREQIGRALFGENVTHLDPSDASALHVEALRATVWNTDRP